MSTDISGKTVRSKRVRYDGGVREERQEEKGEEEVNVVQIDEGADSLRDQGSGSQEATRNLVVQKELIVHRHIVIAAAVCLSLLCVLLVVRTTDMAMDYNSAIENLTLDRNTLQTRYSNLILERDQLQGQINQLKREKAVKVCPSGWKEFGWSCYYRSTEGNTWEESRAECQKTGADLVVINSNEEQEFIRGLKHEDGSSWIGLTTLNRTDGNWTWVDGTPLTTEYWNIGQPADNLYCTVYRHGVGKWNNALCEYPAKFPWICEM